MSFVAHILVCCFTSCRRLCIICMMFQFVLIMNIGHHIHISIRVTSNINVVAKQGRCPQYKQFDPTNVCISDSDCPAERNVAPSELITCARVQFKAVQVSSYISLYPVIGTIQRALHVILSRHVFEQQLDLSGENSVSP